MIYFSLIKKTSLNDIRLAFLVKRSEGIDLKILSSKE
jgi:hypothetical protein